MGKAGKPDYILDIWVLENGVYTKSSDITMLYKMIMDYHSENTTCDIHTVFSLMPSPSIPTSTLENRGGLGTRPLYTAVNRTHSVYRSIEGLGIRLHGIKAVSRID